MVGINRVVGVKEWWGYRGGVGSREWWGSGVASLRGGGVMRSSGGGKGWWL